MKLLCFDLTVSLCLFVVAKTKLMSVFQTSFVWIYSYFDNVITEFMINNRTDTRKTDVSLLIHHSDRTSLLGRRSLNPSRNLPEKDCVNTQKVCVY